jgi:hypothetical protein
MRSTIKSVAANFVKPFKSAAVAIVSFLRRRDAERRRRRAMEEEFYRKIRKLYREKNMPIMWEDEWRMQR